MDITFFILDKIKVVDMKMALLSFHISPTLSIFFPAVLLYIYIPKPVSIYKSDLNVSHQIHTYPIKHYVATKNPWIM